jgi:hypothetical protein
LRETSTALLAKKTRERLPFNAAEHDPPPYGRLLARSGQLPTPQTGTLICRFPVVGQVTLEFPAGAGQLK